MGYNSGKNKGKVLVLSERTFKELNVEFDKLNPGSHQKVYVQCEKCDEVFLRERRKLHQFHRCPTHIVRDDGLKLKWCGKCQNFLAYANFNSNKARADNLNSWCIACCATTKSRKKQDQKKIQARQTFDGWIANYLSAKKSRCKKKGIDCDLTEEILKEMWAFQDGRCYYSKVKLEFGVKAMKAATLDRVDSSKGYISNNVVWCSSSVNSMKNAFSKEELTQFFQDMILTNVRLEYKKTHPEAKAPFRKRTTDAGYDLASVIETTIEPGEVVNVETGLKISAPEGWYLTIDGRSSLFKEGIVPFRGIIDSNYTGPLLISLYNSSETPFKVNIGDRIAQATLHKIYSADFVEVKEFSPDYFVHRGEAGWGSSGRQ